MGARRAVLVVVAVICVAMGLGCDKKEAPAPAQKGEAKVEKKAEAKAEKKAEGKAEKKAEAKVEKKAEAKAEKKGEPMKGERELDTAALKAKADRFAPVKITYDATKLDPNRKEMLKHLLDAADILDGLFWDQVSADGRALLDELSKKDDAHSKLLRRYVRINYGRFDRLSDHEPFIGGGEKPLGANFYPADMTKKEFQDHIAAHPEQKDAFTDEFTIIRRKEGKLVAIPYHEYYGEQLKAAAESLRKAAELAENPTLKRYLESRAAGFLSSDYYRSDVDWMDLEGNLLEVTIGPYEVYEDRLFNYKTAFEAFITLNDPEAAKSLQKVAEYLPKMEEHLPIPDVHKNRNRGSESPVRVVDVIYTSGDTRAGVQTLAFNLPNDERVREAKGSKKVLLRNVSDAKFAKILKPIAEIVVRKDQLPLLSKEAYFNHTLIHEMSHGIGPGNITLPDGTKTTVNARLQELYSALEEAKADTLGIYNTYFLIDEGVLPKEMEHQCAVTTMAGTFRSVRFGAEEAHGKANMIIFNYLIAEGAYTYDAATKRFGVELDKVRPAITKLAKELLMVQALGDYDGGKKLIEKYGKMPQIMKDALAGLTAVPVDIEPIFAAEPR